MLSTLGILILLITQTIALSFGSDMWRQRCAQEFGLAPLPLSSGARLFKLSEADNETWKRYHDYRSRIQQEASMDNEDAEMDVDENDGKTELLHAIQRALRNEAKHVKYEPWLDHTFQRINDLQWEDESEIRSITTCATIFSPFLLPHAVELENRYHCRPRSTWSEFYCYWHFRLLRFDGEPNGDDVQQELALKYPKDIILMNPTYVADDEMEVLCSNGYKDPPQVMEEVDWVAVQDIDVHNFTPNTVRRIRDWLFGPNKSTELRDFCFLRLLFASFGTSNFQLLHGNVGHFWFMSRKLHNQLIDDGVVERDDTEFDRFTGLNWLEYQARLVAGALRPFDKYYVPYDTLEAKSEWGLNVLEVCEEGQYNQGDDDLDLSTVPWMVWERAEMTSSTMRMAMQLMMQLRN